MLLRIFDPTKIPTEMPWPILYMLLFITVPCIPSIIKLLIQVENNKAWLKRQEEYAEQAAKTNKFTEKIEHPSIEVNRFNVKFKVGDRKFIESVYDEIGDDLKMIFGEDYRKKFVLPGKVPRGCEYYCPSNNSIWALHLYLAKKYGKVDGIVSGCVSGFDLGQGDEVRWQIEILKRVEYYLVKAHPEEGDNVRLYQMAPYWDTTGSWNRVLEVMDPDGSKGSLYCTKVGLGFWHKGKGRRLW